MGQTTEPGFQRAYDLKRERRISRQIKRTMEGLYKHLGRDRSLSEEYMFPEGPITTHDDRAVVESSLLRKLDDGNFATEAVVKMFPVVQSHNGAKHVFGLRGMTIGRPAFARYHVDDMFKTTNETAPRMARKIFEAVKESGFIEYDGIPNYLPLDIAYDIDPDFPEMFGFETVSSASVMPEKTATNAEKSHYRRLWTKREKFIHEAAKRLKSEFQRQSGHLFKTVKIDINPDTERFRLTFQAKRAFEGRYTVLEGNFNIKWDKKNRLASEFTFNIESASLRREFQHVALPVIDITDEPMAAAEMLKVLYETQSLAHNPRAETLAWTERQNRPNKKDRAVAHRVDRRRARQSTHQMRFH